MTTFSKIAALLILFTTISTQSQTSDNLQLKALLESKEFVFIPESAIPQGLPTVNLSSSNNFLKIHPEIMEANLPYFGRAYSSTSYGGDGGIKFYNPPIDYKLTENKKNFEITATVNGESDSYRINLNVGFDGSATLFVSPNKRSSISYFGNIIAPEIKK